MTRDSIEPSPRLRIADWPLKMPEEGTVRTVVTPVARLASRSASEGVTSRTARDAAVGSAVAAVMATTPGASAHSGAASRNRAPKQTDRLDILTSAAGHHIICLFHHGPLQLRHERNHREDRLLRPRSVREDDEPAVRLRLA